LPWLFVDADTSFTRARFRDVGAAGAGALTASVAGLPLRRHPSGGPPNGELVPRAPRWLASAGVQARHPAGFFGSLRARYVSSFPLVANGDRDSYAYTLVDLVLGWESARVQLSLSAQNLFNTTWRDSEYSYQSVADPARELTPRTDVHFRPGEPFLLLGNVKVLF